jgi:hypothetical protein
MKKLLYLSLLGVFACNLEKEIEITLPPYISLPFVECYIEHDQPLRVLITKSTSYFNNFNFDDPALLSDWLLQNAKVTISFGGVKYELTNILFSDSISGKFYNYYHPAIVSKDETGPFLFQVLLPNGEELISETNILNPVAIDSIVIQFNADSKARALTYFSDPKDEINYYRRVLHKNTVRSEPLQNFTTDDRFASGTLVFGSGYEFIEGDTIINTLYHISKPHFNFLESLQRAVDGNGNPFAQPSPIQSNIAGKGFGIFAGLSFDQSINIVKK